MKNRKAVKLWIGLLFFCLFSPISSQTNDLEILVSSVSIPIAKYDQNVRHNLRLAIDKMNRKMIKPGEVFSFNTIVGEGSVENGFLFASAYFADESILEPGGGLCIAATGVFNVLLKTGFKIVERRKHSRPVSYIQPGLDATISYGKSDLKMKNIYKTKFELRAEMFEERIDFRIYSDSQLNFEYEPGVKITEESMLQQDSSPYNAGLMVDVFRDKLENGVKLETEYLYTDYIRPVIKRKSR